MTGTARLPYGDRWLEADTTGLEVIGELRVPATGEVLGSPAAIASALARPVAGVAPVEVVQPGESVVVTVSDGTRRTGMERVLPVLLAAWQERGVDPAAVQILLACGTHRRPDNDELRTILGPGLYRALEDRIFVHQASEEQHCRQVGVTSRGTPVRVNRRALVADRLVVTGTVRLHYFAGFSGGRKGILPGIAAASTISANHRLNIDTGRRCLDPEVRIGRLRGNPVSDDMDEAAALVGVDCLINSVLDGGGRLAGLFCGDLQEAHRAAAGLAGRLFQLEIPEPADLVIAAAGGERNWVQSHKCLYNASLAAAEHGVVVLLAACPEGLGSDNLARWLTLGSVEAVLDELCRRSEIYGQTALSTLLRGECTVLVSQLPDDTVRRMRMTPAHSLDEALALARRRLAAACVGQPRTYLMPQAGLTVPVLRRSG